MGETVLVVGKPKFGSDGLRRLREGVAWNPGV